MSQSTALVVLFLVEGRFDPSALKGAGSGSLIPLTLRFVVKSASSVNAGLKRRRARKTLENLGIFTPRKRKAPVCAPLKLPKVITLETLPSLLQVEYPASLPSS